MLKRNPDPVINSSLDPLGFEAKIFQVTPDLICELWCILVWPFVFVDEWLCIVEVVDKVMLEEVISH